MLTFLLNYTPPRTWHIKMLHAVLWSKEPKAEGRREGGRRNRYYNLTHLRAGGLSLPADAVNLRADKFKAARDQSILLIFWWQTVTKTKRVCVLRTLSIHELPTKFYTFHIQICHSVLMTALSGRSFYPHFVANLCNLPKPPCFINSEGLELETFWLHLGVFAPNSGGFSENMCFYCAKEHNHREHGQGSPTSQKFLFNCKFVRCVWLCAGGRTGKTGPWSRGARISEGCDMKSSSGSRQTKHKKQHGVCWKQCSNSAVVCAAVQMISGLGLESARIQCKCHKQFRNRDACCTWFVFPIFKSPLQLDFQNTFVILMVWWKYCLPDLCKNWLQERLILWYKGTTSFP